MLVLSVGVGNGVATVGIGVAADGGVAAGGAAGIDGVVVVAACCRLPLCCW